MTDQPQATKTTSVANVPAAVHEWSMQQRQGKAFLMSGYLPQHIYQGAKGAEESLARVLTIMQKGKELGLAPMHALSSITVIKGKPCLSAELMLGLCYQRVKGFKATFSTAPEKQNTECTVTMQRFGGDPQTFRFTMQDAQKAGLVTKGSAWEKYPSSMLRARAISAGCRVVAPDATMGSYTPEEMGGYSIDIPDMAPAALPSQIPQGENNAATAVVTQDIDESLVTEAQIKRLYAIGKTLGMNHDNLKDGAKALFGREHLQELTKTEIQEYFKELESQLSDADEGADDTVV